MDAYINSEFAKNVYNSILTMACDLFHSRAKDLEIAIEDKYHTRMDLIRDTKKSGNSYPITLSEESKRMLLCALAEIMSHAEAARNAAGESRAELAAQIGLSWEIADVDIAPSKEYSNIKIIFRNKLEEIGVYDYVALYYADYMALFVEKIMQEITLFGLREHKKIINVTHMEHAIHVCYPRISPALLVEMRGRAKRADDSGDKPNEKRVSRKKNMARGAKPDIAKRGDAKPDIAKPKPAAPRKSKSDDSYESITDSEAGQSGDEVLD